LVKIGIIVIAKGLLERAEFNLVGKSGALKLTIILVLGLIFISSLISDKYNVIKTEVGDIKLSINPVDKTTNDLNIKTIVNINVSIDDKLKGMDLNIFKAARTALFNFENEIASYYNYKQSVNEYVIFYDVIDHGDKHWEVRYRTKENESDSYQQDGYSMVNVEQDKSGHFSGYIIHSSPAQIAGQTN
jgi:hypothetical protein